MSNRDYFFLNGDDEGEDNKIPIHVPNDNVTPQQALNDIVNAAVTEFAEATGMEGPLHVSLMIDDDATRRAKNNPKYISFDIGRFLSDISNEHLTEFLGTTNYALTRLALIKTQIAMVQDMDQYSMEEYVRDIDDLTKQAHLVRIQLLKLIDMINFTAFKAYHKSEYDAIVLEDEDSTESKDSNNGSSDSPHDGTI